MSDRNSRGPLAGCSNEEIELFDRLATQYSNSVLEYARICSLACMASRAGDFGKFAAVKRSLDELGQECRRYQVAIRVLTEDCRRKYEMRAGRR